MPATAASNETLAITVAIPSWEGRCDCINSGVQNFRSIRSTDWIDVASLTALIGQNEAGKSNLLEALFHINPFTASKYNIDEDWPVDDWGSRDASTLVCEARFALDNAEEILTLVEKAGLLSPDAPPKADAPVVERPTTFDRGSLPSKMTLRVRRHFDWKRTFSLEIDGTDEIPVPSDKGEAWAAAHLPKCVLIADYDLPELTIDLPALSKKFTDQKWEGLSQEERGFKIILDLAKINLSEIVAKGESAPGRTLRSYDTRLASAYLSEKYAQLWTQKKVRFDIAVDAATLNVFVHDEGVGMPVRLGKRSKGFRWQVGFAFKFTHASGGEFKNCILLLEEPGSSSPLRGAQRFTTSVRGLGDIEYDHLYDAPRNNDRSWIPGTG